MRLLLGSLLVLSVVGCTEDEALPPILASSKYIDFHMDADETVTLQCPESLLAREDRFIERTAETLGVEVPAGRIHFVWRRTGARESCDGAFGCYRYREGEGDGVIVSSFRRE